MALGLFRHAGPALLLLASTSPCLADDAAIIRGLLGIGGGVVEQRNRPRGDWVLEGPLRRGQRLNDGAPTRRSAPRDPDASLAETRDKTIALRQQIQKRLNVLGYSTGVPDGVFGARSRQAIAQFQESIGETPDGKITESQIATLYQMTGDDAQVAAGDPDTSPFPSLGKAKPGENAAGGEFGFPPLGARGTASAGGPAFPAIGTPAAAGADLPPLSTPDKMATDGKGFPSLGRPNSDAAGSSGFPSLSAGAVEPSATLPALAAPARKPAETLPALAAAPAATAFPAMAADGGAKPPSYPELAGPDGPPTGFPALAASKPPARDADGATSPAASDVATEVKRIDRLTSDTLPKVLDIGLGFSLAEVADALKPGGFSDCAQKDGVASCMRTTSSLDDRILAFGEAGGAIWGIERRIEFKQPVKRDFILTRLGESMPTLMKDDDLSMASRPACTKNHARTIAPEQRMEAVAAALARKDSMAVDPDLAFVSQCPLLFDVSLAPQDGDVQSVDIWFFDGTPLLRRDAARRSDEASRDAEALKLVDQDLKL